MTARTARRASRVPTLIGRRAECEALDRLLSDAADGRSRALVLRGEAGVGKSALLGHLADRAAGWRVARVVGVPSEAELAYGGLHQLCAPLMHLLDRLPAPRREALAIAFGLSAGPAADRFLVGLGALALLVEAAGERPLLCTVDDAQWLDEPSEQILGFVARRLVAERVAILVAARTGLGGDVLPGLPDLPVGRLGDSEARALLLQHLHCPLDAAVREQVIAESRGNPLALLELPRAWNAAELAGGYALPGSRPVACATELEYLERLAELPCDARLLVLVAAADPLGDPLLVHRAAATLGVKMAAANDAEDAGLLMVRGRVEFAHPLVRSAAYRSAAAEDRRRVHRALADATDAETDPDRRAWHRARSTPGPDEAVAADLERSAGLAQAHGGLAAAAAFLARATELTLDPERRAARGLAAAEAKHQAGAPEAARRLLAETEGASSDETHAARALRLRGRLAAASRQLRDAPALLLEAARRLEVHEPAAAPEAYVEALEAAIRAGRLGGEVGPVQVARAVRGAALGGGGPASQLAEGIAAVITAGYAAGAPLLRRAVAALREGDPPATHALGLLGAGTRAARDVWDDEGWELLSRRHERLVRGVGALAALPAALTARVGVHLVAGELGAAATLVEEIAAVADATGEGCPGCATAALAAWRGREAEALELIAPIRAELALRGDGMALTILEGATAVLHNGLGRYEEACEAAASAAARQHELAFANWALVELAEAAIRSDRPELARSAVQRLARTTRPCGSDWALGIEARSRALVSDGAVAEAFHREAIERLGRTRARAELARAQLLFGEWLRRAGRRTEAREQLRVSREAFLTMGMEAFADRAARELLATGERARRRVDEARADLTPQEAQIAHLVCEGLSNPEIGARLYISARTVEWHLRKVFAKLGISSRRQLSRALPRALTLTAAAPR